MRDKTHVDELVRWARYVKDNPDDWKLKVKPFIDSQYIMSRRFYKNLLKTNKETLRKLGRMRES
ncbi:MAG: hypothetical protein Q8N99_04995 [Nanoarchaeota archaeon]|nr:hypothetical protein [Nanoarchaeota archaeon]